MCVIGGTGSGKSASCKSITGIKSNDIFMPSDSINSVTTKTKGILTNWFGNKNKEQIFVLDTPGLGDTKGRDPKHIAEMVCAL